MTVVRIGLTLGFILSSFAQALAQERTITVKNGESVEIARLYSVLDCKVNAKMPPKVELLVGPPQLSILVKEAKVMPTLTPLCKNEVDGAIVYLIANEVKEVSTETVVVRWQYAIKYGGTVNRGR